MRVRLDKKAASISLLVVLSVRRDGQKVLPAGKNRGGESEAAWRALLDDLVARGLKTPEFLINRITRNSDSELDGAIILMHVGVRSTADALPAIIANLQGRGFNLVTISTLLE